MFLCYEVCGDANTWEKLLGRNEILASEASSYPLGGIDGKECPLALVVPQRCGNKLVEGLSGVEVIPDLWIWSYHQRSHRES